MIYRFDRSDAERFAREQGISVRQNGEKELVFDICPYCKSKKDKKKFAINLQTGMFNCFRAGCGAKGNMITLAKDFDFSLGREADVYYKEMSWRKFKTFPKDMKVKVRPAAVEYMQSRGISERTTNLYGITTQKEHDNVLVFPFCDPDGTLVNVKYRKTDFDKAKDNSKEWFEKDCKPVLFGMDKCNPANKTLILTEGQIDSLSVSEAGFENAVSVPGGKNSFTWVPYCWDWLQQFDEVIVFGDCERGEITLLDDMRKRFNGRVKFIPEEYYKGCKDANDIIRKFGPDGIRNAINNAITVPDVSIKRMVDVKKVDTSKLERIKTGFPTLDRYLGGLYFGNLVILTGERGLGKSTVGSQLIANAVNQGYNTFCYSGELPDWQFRGWMDRQIAGPNHINGIVDESGHSDFSVDGSVIPSMEKWYRDKILIYDNMIDLDKEGEEIASVVETVKLAIINHGCRVLLIDNLMTAIIDNPAADRNQNLVQTEFVKKLVRLATMHNVIIILVAHPRKTQGGNSFGNDDVAGSSNITNLAHVVLKYGRPAPKEEPDSDGKKKKILVYPGKDERVITVHKDRNNGYVNEKGIAISFDAPSKRLFEGQPTMGGDSFGWKYGWEEEFTESGTTPFDEDLELDLDWEVDDL